MKSLNHYVNNPIVINTTNITLEGLEFKDERNVNRLFKLNLRKIVKEKSNKDKMIIHCVNGRMFYRK
jgi:hypothetical protein